MLLTDDQGTVVDYFERFPAGNNIGLSLSGGTDSALILFLLIEMVYRRKDRVKIYPIHGYDTYRKVAESWRAAEKVVSWIRDYYINAYELKELSVLQPLEVFSYCKTDDDKEKHHKPHFRYMMNRYNIPFIIRGVTQGMFDEKRPNQELLSDEEIYNYNGVSEDWIYTPWARVNKKFIYHQYKKYGIMKLSKLTVSCVDDMLEPCKTCWWCRERKWAFGTYDGGLL